MADTDHIFIIQGALRACSHSEMLLLAEALMSSLSDCTPSDLEDVSTYAATLQWLGQEYEVP